MGPARARAAPRRRCPAERLGLARPGHRSGATWRVATWCRAPPRCGSSPPTATMAAACCLARIGLDDALDEDGQLVTGRSYPATERIEFPLARRGDRRLARIRAALRPRAVARPGRQLVAAHRHRGPRARPGRPPPRRRTCERLDRPGAEGRATARSAASQPAARGAPSCARPGSGTGRRRAAACARRRRGRAAAAPPRRAWRALMLSKPG